MFSTVGREGLCTVVAILAPVAPFPMAAAACGATADSAMANPLVAFFGAAMRRCSSQVARLKLAGLFMHTEPDRLVLPPGAAFWLALEQIVREQFLPLRVGISIQAYRAHVRGQSSRSISIT